MYRAYVSIVGDLVNCGTKLQIYGYVLFALHMYDLVCNLSCTISDNVPGFLVMQCVSKRVFSDTLLRDIPMSNL